MGIAVTNPCDQFLGVNVTKTGAWSLISRFLSSVKCSEKNPQIRHLGHAIGVLWVQGVGQQNIVQRLGRANPTGCMRDGTRSRVLAGQQTIGIIKLPCVVSRERECIGCGCLSSATCLLMKTVDLVPVHGAYETNQWPPKSAIRMEQTLTAKRETCQTETCATGDLDG